MSLINRRSTIRPSLRGATYDGLPRSQSRPLGGGVEFGDRAIIESSASAPSRAWCSCHRTIRIPPNRGADRPRRRAREPHLGWDFGVPEEESASPDLRPTVVVHTPVGREERSLGTSVFVSR